MIPSTVGFLDQDFEIETQPKALKVLGHVRSSVFGMVTLDPLT